jgi:hypothetical protein
VNCTSGELKLRVVGIIKDYHQESLKTKFDPIVFYPETDINRDVYSIKLGSKNYPEVLESIKKIWTARFPDSPFNFAFLDERFNAQYKNDRQFSVILWWFTALGYSGCRTWDCSGFHCTPSPKEKKRSASAKCWEQIHCRSSY